MNLLVYLGSITFLMLASRLSPSLDKIFTVMIAIVLVLFAALRIGGFDYIEYINTIESLRALDSIGFLEMAALSKDPLFGAIVYTTKFISEDPEWVIYGMIILAVSTKLAFSLSISKYSAIFLGMYAILLAPGLEFAAMRASIGLGCLALAGLAFTSKGRQIGWSLVASLSHISMVPASALLLATQRLKGVMLFLVFTLLAVGTHFSFQFTYFDFTERALSYSDNQGTVLAYLPPLTTLAILLFSFNSKTLNEIEEVHSSARTFFNTALGLVGISLGFTGQMVTVSTRFIEISWFFMLVLFVQGISHRRNFHLILGIVAFTMLLSYINIYRNTWSIFSEMGLLE